MRSVIRRAAFAPLLPLVLMMSLAFLATGCGESAALREERERAMDPVELGRKIHSRVGCAACHSLDGTRLAGPSYAGLLAEDATLADGAVVARDEAYLREAILRPGLRLTRGYGPSMPDYSARLKDYEVDALIALLRSLK